MRKPPTLLLAIGGAIAAIAVVVALSGNTGAPARHPRQGSRPAASDAAADLLWPAPPDPMERTVAAGLGARAARSTDQSRPRPPGRLRRRPADRRSRGHRDQHREPRCAPVRRTRRFGLLRRHRAVRRRVHLAPPHALSDRHPPHRVARLPSRTRSASSSPSGASNSATPAWASSATRSRSRSTSTASSLTGTRARSS